MQYTFELRRKCGVNLCRRMLSNTITAVIEYIYPGIDEIRTVARYKVEYYIKFGKLIQEQHKCKNDSCLRKHYVTTDKGFKAFYFMTFSLGNVSIKDFIIHSDSMREILNRNIPYYYRSSVCKRHQAIKSIVK